MNKKVSLETRIDKLDLFPSIKMAFGHRGIHTLKDLLACEYDDLTSIKKSVIKKSNI